MAICISEEFRLDFLKRYCSGDSSSRSRVDRIISAVNSAMLSPSTKLVLQDLQKLLAECQQAKKVQSYRKNTLVKGAQVFLVALMACQILNSFEKGILNTLGVFFMAACFCLVLLDLEKRSHQQNFFRAEKKTLPQVLTNPLKASGASYDLHIALLTEIISEIETLEEKAPAHRHRR